MAAATVLHITDHHVYSDETRANEGVVPAKTMAKVLAAAKAKVPSPAALLLTGDFTNDDTAGSYQLVLRLIRETFPAPTPVMFVPGNHEDLPILEGAFLPEFTGPGGDQKLAAADVAGWRMLLVSTYIKRKVHGEIDAQTLAQLTEELDACDAAGKPALIALHHPPVPPAGDAPPWGKECLHNPEALYELLRTRKQARVVVHGHLHTEFKHPMGNAVIYCTPSTCHQTLPASPTWQRDVDSLPGFRLFHLSADGGHTSEVHRVDISDCLAEP